MQKKGKDNPKFKDKTGEEGVNIEGDVMEIVEYFNALNVTIKFSDNTIVINKTYSSFKKGNIKNPNYISVHGIGFTGVGKYIPFENRKMHTVWTSMLCRCTNNYSKRFPTYVGVKVCEHWYNFQNFAKWFEENYKPEYMQGWHLDKDILIKGNGVYSPETCSFVPAEINYIFSKKKGCRGNYPIGVNKVKNKYQATISINGKRLYLGTFNTSEEAFQIYKITKETYIKQMASKWKPYIDERVYKAMRNYKVEITD